MPPHRPFAAAGSGGRHPSVIVTALITAVLLSPGCGPEAVTPSPDADSARIGSRPLDRIAATEDLFLDDVRSNAEVPEDVASLEFTRVDGDPLKLSDYLGRRHVVLVFTQGYYGGSLCPFCTTQVSRLIANYDRFVDAGAEVLVVYPGDDEHLDEFIGNAASVVNRQIDRTPFPLLLDADLSAVRFFGIESHLAHPSTFVLDRDGNVRLAYVGADRSADRPSIDAMLAALD